MQSPKIRTFSPNMAATLLSAIIVVFFGVHYAPSLDVGELQQFDEYFTLDRSVGFERSGNWLSVSSNYEPNFNKPPLQYWLTALMLESGLDLELSLRFWSFAFALALLAGTGLLAFALAPERPAAIPASIAVLASSPMLWEHALSALLDVGAGLFFILPIAGFVLALRNPRWWIFVAITVGLGSLQKAPAGAFAVALLCIATLAYQKLTREPSAFSLAEPYFRRSVVIGAILVSAWPIVQVVQHGFSYIDKAYIDQIFERFAPSLEGGQGLSTDFRWIEWLMADRRWVWLIALLGSVAIPFLYKRPASLFLVLLISVFCALMTLAGGRVFERYLMLLIPLLSVALVLFLIGLLRSGLLALLVAAALIAAGGSFFLDTNYLLRPIQSRHLALIMYFKDSIKPEETPLFCDWRASSKSNDPRVYPGMLYYHADLGRPVVRLTRVERLRQLEEKGQIEPPYRAVCSELTFQELEPELYDYVVVRQDKGNLIWIREGGRDVGLSN